MIAELPVRTKVRDIFVSALEMISRNPDARIKEVEVVTDYLHETEIKKSASYGVIVTDEQPEDPMMRTREAIPIMLTVLIVIYVRSETDRRTMLDAAIEDIWDTLRSGQLVKSVVPDLLYMGLQTDEGPTAMKPYSVAKMQWAAKGLRRTVSW